MADLPPGPPGTLLIVDDNETILAIVAAGLQALGFPVQCASDSAEALEFARAHRINALVTDVLLPRGNGAQLAASVRALHPDVRIVYCSGYPRETLTGQGIETAPWPLLEKPFAFEDLLACLTGSAPQLP